MVKAALAAFAFTSPLAGQAASAAGPEWQQGRAQEPIARETIVREIDDAATGDRWLLERDANRSGPGRLVRLETRTQTASWSDAAALGAPAQENSSAKAKPAQPDSTPAPVIRAGDALAVSEHSAIVDAYLEAVALGTAAAGAAFPARLKIGGKVVRVVALAPGRAALSPLSGTAR